MPTSDLPPPTLTTTYRWEDATLNDDYWWWSTDDFAHEMDLYEPAALIVETWGRTSVERRWMYPPLVTCTYEDSEPCEEDAVQWQLEDDTWMQACDRHAALHPIEEADDA